jgi:hypothetical protein
MRAVTLHGVAAPFLSNRNKVSLRGEKSTSSLVEHLAPGNRPALLY